MFANGFAEDVEMPNLDGGDALYVLHQVHHKRTFPA